MEDEERLLPTGEEEKEGEGRDQSLTRAKWKDVLISCYEAVFPILTTQNSRKRLSYRRSFAIVFTLYLSHVLSAWGDRMWMFAVSLFMYKVYPGSLLLPAVYGFITSLCVAMLGTIAGDWVDLNPRMRVIWVSLLVQNLMVAVSSVVLSLMFLEEWGVCKNIPVFVVLTVLVFVFSSVANLATTANTISVEKDWVVVIADKRPNTLATLNANMRRIDLVCKLLAPIVAGVLLQYAQGFATTLVVAGWNVVSFFGELSLLWAVYKMLPSLAMKKLRKSQQVDDEEEEEEEEKEMEEEEKEMEEEEKEMEEEEKEKEEKEINSDGEDDSQVKMKPTHKGSHAGSTCRCNWWLKRLFSPLYTLKNGFKIFIRQEIALVGFALAAIYLTVLGFSGVTAAYFITQHLNTGLIGLFQGVGGILGICGTILYPSIRRRVGTVRAGLIGFSLQLTMLLFSGAAVFAPGVQISNQDTGYYSPECNNSDEFSPNSSYSLSSSWSPQLTATITPSPSLPSSSYSTIFSTATFSPQAPSLLPSTFTTLRPSSSILSSPPPSPPGEGVSISLVLMLIGVVGARFGLWMFDLSVWQLVQEKVKEEERGVVSGVMNAMNSIMDMMHYVLVIAAPRPEHFRWLALLSVVMVFTGWLLYAIYVRKARGHFFHFSKLRIYLKKGGRGVGNEQPQLTVINAIVEVPDSEEEEEAEEK